MRAALERAPEYLESLHGRTFYAVGGTWRALARAASGSNAIIRSTSCTATSSIRKTGSTSCISWSEVDAKTLKDIESVSEARRPLLAYGAIVLEEIIRLGEPKEIAISASACAKACSSTSSTPETQERDPLIAAASDLNLLRSRSPRHGEELCEWTEGFMTSLGLPETENEAPPAPRRLPARRYRLARPSRLSRRAEPQPHRLWRPSRASTIRAAPISRSPIFFRHEGLSPDKVGSRIKALAGPRYLERARLLAALMRVAYPVSVSMEGILPQAPLRARGSQVVLQLPRLHAGPRQRAPDRAHEGRSASFSTWSR